MAGPKDDLKWFGEGFDGFPKRLPEDTVEYLLFIINPKLTQRETLSRLEAVRREASKFSDSVLDGYIWQRDEFMLNLEVDNQRGLKYLRGLTNYGDSVEDEWLIVYLLKELSGRFQDLWIKVVDTDGEFMLIEAANALPRWLNPEIADNRIWINDNKLRIIPLTAVPKVSTSNKTVPVSKTLSQEEAHAIISTRLEILIHSPLVEAEAFYRLRNYPNQVLASLHFARITIPRKLAYLLHKCPAFIAPAVEAFYLRDPIALKPLQSDIAVLRLPPDDLITTSIKFTKVLYAQLRSQQFSSPTVWKPIIVEAEKSKSVNMERLEMGVKVTSGFEMLLTDPKNADNRSVREINILLEDLDAGDDTLPDDNHISAWKDSNREDSEAWLDINFEDFERELAGKSNAEYKSTGGGAKSKGPPGAFGPDPASGFGDAKTQADLQKMVSRFESFLNDEDAGIDGAEMDEMDYDDDDEEDDDDSDDEDEDKDVSFDEKEFARMMREMMGMPNADEEEEEATGANKGRNHMSKKTARFEELGSDDSEVDEEDEAEEIRKVMARMEAELNEAGALNLDPTPKKVAALRQRPDMKSTSSKGKTPEGEKDDDEESESDGEVDIDFNLAKNLLESFKSQAGMAGPGGNLLGMMGMRLPRDEGDHNDTVKPGELGKRVE